MDNQLEYRYSICIGDYSCDGHNQAVTYIFRCNYPEDEIIKAYLACEKKIKIGLSNYIKSDKNRLFDNYQERGISDKHLHILLENGIIPLDHDKDWNTPDDVLMIFMNMVKFSLPDFIYEVEEDPPLINGYNDKFHTGLGYGVFE